MNQCKPIKTYDADFLKHPSLSCHIHSIPGLTTAWSLASETLEWHPGWFDHKSITGKLKGALSWISHTADAEAEACYKNYYTTND